MSLKKLRSYFLFLTILFCATFVVSAQNKIEIEEYDIYKLLLGVEMPRPNRNPVVISKFTINESDSINNQDVVLFIKRKISKIKSETIEDFFRRNQTSVEIINNFGNAPIIIINAKDMYSIDYDKKPASEEEFREAFKEKYSTEEINFLSRVGFNKKKDQALVEYGFNCGSTCGQSSYVFLSKQNGRWVVKKSVLSAIS